METKEPKKGYESLKAAVERTIEGGRSFSTPEQLRKRMQWVLDRAQQYADACGVDRETVLEQWEKSRDYCWDNYYQECNQPDLKRENGTPVMFYDEWMAKGKKLYGDNPLDWRYKCPQCGHVQTPREFKEKGIDPNQAITCCASRYWLGGKDTCKWTTGGLLRIGGVYVITKEFHPVLAFAFADEEKKD